MGMSFAATAGMMAVCPLCDPKPHVGGPVVVAGKRTVLIGGAPAAVTGDRCVCAGPPPNTIRGGSGSVRVCGQPLARMGDATTHNGAILIGCPTVMVG